MLREIPILMVMVAGVLCLATGALLLWPARGSNTRIPGWRDALFRMGVRAFLDQRITLERWFYRNHRMAGIVVVVGAIALLCVLWGLEALGVDGAAGGPFAHPFAVTALWVAAWFALGVGAVVYVRPSALKRIEATANRWIEPFPPADSQSGARGTCLPRVIAGSPGLAGVLFIAAGLSCCAVAIASWPV